MVAREVRGASDAVVRARCAFVALAASLAGVALQLCQPMLWDGMVYAGGLLAGIAGLWLAWLLPRHAGTAWVWAALAGAAIGAGLAGARASVYAAGALDPALEGHDLQLVGVVSQLPQRGEAGTRFRFAVESARWADPSRTGSPAVPERIALGWYVENGGLWNDAPAASAPELLPASPVHAGERWRLTVRLKAPHGHRNPHGFEH